MKLNSKDSPTDLTMLKGFIENLEQSNCKKDIRKCIFKIDEYIRGLDRFSGFMGAMVCSINKK